MRTGTSFGFIVVTPAGAPDAALAIAGCRAGALGVLNLEFCDDTGPALAACGELAAHGRGWFGVLVDRGEEAPLKAILEGSPPGLEVVLLGGGDAAEVRARVELIHRHGRLAYVVASTLEGALLGRDAGGDAIVAKGHEAGGWVGEETTFVLLQRLMARLDCPVFAQGGVGLHTAAACRAAGAAGVVLDGQLLMARESPLPPAARTRIGAMDGSETACLGAPLGAGFRAYSRPGLPIVGELGRLEAAAMAADGSAEGRRREWRAAIRRRVGWQHPEGQVLAVGQDAAFAAGLSRRFATVGGILDGLRRSIDGHCRAARRLRPLGAGAALAESHRTRYPIVQGPMTRVSDRAEFAAAVAEAGALPFLALALMRAGEVRELLAGAQRLLGDRPWGVGILGFVPPELRAEQLEVIRDVRPPFALIAGGRPDQARTLEADGIPTYLHTPSPGLLRLFLQEGSRRFVFEGRECGGHVGPRTSFVLWESMVDVLIDHVPADADAGEFHILFAGGIHDGPSAAMVAALAAPLAERGMRIGVLLGTAYLFTEEAVQAGAILPGYQRAALSCDRTVLLESGPGLATRCVPSPFAEVFAEEKRRMIREGLSPEELRNRLELLNIGRLRVASKGKGRDPRHRDDPTAPKLVDVSDDDQWSSGIYMIGQVAALHKATCTLDELHRAVSDGSAERLEALAPEAPADDPTPPPAAVAIVGMATILPGAADLQGYWANILNRVDAITEVPPDRWDWRRYYDEDRAARDKVYSRWGGFIGDVPFDPVLYGMPPSSIPSIEPFQLLALAVVRSALRDAGYLERPFRRDRTSVILGAGGGGADLTSGYMVRSSLPHLLGAEGAADIVDHLEGRLPRWTEDSFAGILMNVAAGRVANRFDLGGVNYTVDAACASSLAAVYLAVRDLEAGTSDMAIVGGVDAIQNPFAFLCFSKTQALSPTGRCRPFDAQADGIAISEGMAAVVMKRLADAERDGDRIYGVIRGVGGSSDGRDRSLTAPRPEGQMRALDRAYAQAGFSPATVGLLEAHGTGTVAGDQAEVHALTEVFDRAQARRHACAIGSVKSMIGHTKATAGVAGLVKVALALRHRVLPPTLGVTVPNPKANFPTSPFYVNSEARPWVHGDRAHPRRAGVSAFGFGGTNFHIALEEYDGEFLADRDAVLDPWPAELFLWRARAKDELLGAVDDLLGALERGARPRLADLACTLAARAGDAAAGGPGLAIVAESLADLAEKLRRGRDLLRGDVAREHAAQGVHYAARPMAEEGRVAFLFPGQGSQYVNMARDLALAFPEARACFDRADAALDGRLARPLSGSIFPPPAFGPGEEQRQQAALTETDVAQPALGAAEIACLRVLRALGIAPEMVGGHSYGELMALHAAGCFDEETLLRLSEARGRFIREGATEEAGAMAAVEAGPEALGPLLADPDLMIANFNSPRQIVLSGTRDAIERAIAWCGGRELPARRLPVACAFHSPLVAPARRRLAELLRCTPITPPRVPVFSNTTASAYPEDPAAIAEILGEHLVRPVEFTRQVEAMYRAGARIFVEVGPRRVLSALVGQILGERPHVLASLDRPGRHGLVSLLDALATLASEGIAPGTGRLYQGRTASRLDLSHLEQETGQPRHSRTTWLVNGGRARPPQQAGTPAEAPPAPPRVRVLDGAPAAASPRLNGVAPSPETRRPAGPLPPSTRSAGPPSPGRARQEEGATPVGPAPRDRQILPSLIEDTLKMIHETVHDLGPPPPAPSPPRSAGRREILPQPLNPAMAAEVIRQFQQVMQQFLQTQQSVMHDLIRAYCGGAGMDATPPIPEAPATRGSATVAPAPNGSAAIRAALPAAIESRVQRHEGASAPPAANGETAHGPNGVAPLAPHREPDRPPEPRVAEARHVPAPAEAAPASRRPVATSDRPRLQRRLLEIVSDRTGYPVEMLPPDADLEADLGIDSIKRVEIAGTIVRELEWPPDAPPDLERLTGSRTLRQVVDQLEAMLGSAVGSVPEGGHERPFDEGRGDHPIGRFVLRPIFAPPVIRRAGLAPAGVVLIVDDRIGVGERLAARLAARGHRAVRIVPGTGDADADGSSIVADVGRPEGVSRLVEQFHRSHGPAAALVHLAALGPGAGAIGMDPARWRARLAGDLESLFLLAQALRPDLERAAAAGGAALLGATALGGAFAADGLCPDFFAGHGATAGLLKTLAHEWPTIRVKAVDVGPAAPGSIADDLMGELMADDGIVEVGYRDGRRTVLRVADAPVGADAAAPPLDGDSVVLITGGARGITAEAAIKLAATYRPRLLLVGRTPPPSGPEPSETAGMADPRSLRQAILDRRRREGRPIAPAAVEDEYRRLVREREVRLNLDRLRRTGARVEYLTCDVRDADAFAALIERIYRTGSRIDGVIHGAGIIEDRLLRDKDLDSFRRVLETKVNGAIVLAGALRPESLRFLVFFGSVSGRFGNRGQADYAAANEVLNKLAQHLDQRWPARVVSINWGPWLTSGMVSAEVRRQFAERGVALIPVEEGCRRLEEELRLGRKGDVEVLIGGAGAPEREAEVMPNSSAPSPSQVDAGQGNEVADRPMPLLAASTILTRSRDGVDLVRTLDLRLDRYLDDHRIDGRPVLPLAMAMEFMAEAASAGWPGYEVIGLRDVRLMRGVILDGESTAIRLTARPTAAAPASTGTESGLMLDVTIAPVEDPRSVHYRASVDLMRVARGERDGRGPSPAPDLPALDAAGPFPMSLEEAYRDWLFHGPLFRGLASLDAIGPGGARARSWPSSPGACLGGEPRGAWLIDPVVLDCAFQVQVLWARLHWDVTLLPTMVRSYRRLAPAPEGAAHGGARLGRASDPPGGIPGIRLEMRIRDDSRAPLCHADHHVFDHEGRPLAIVTGAEAAGSRALNRLTLGARR